MVQMLDMRIVSSILTMQLESGFHVEVDVHYYKNNFYLGHDEPAFLTSLEFLENKSFGVMPRVWIQWEHFIKLSVIIFGMKQTQ